MRGRDLASPENQVRRSVEWHGRRNVLGVSIECANEELIKFKFIKRRGLMSLLISEPRIKSRDVPYLILLAQMNLCNQDMVRL